ncbi:MAG TPA: hypothetical protein VKX17_23840 [Planctomycetota bacterium]|nr:hypothetical protein [Planctomycetota bacterium]
MPNESQPVQPNDPNQQPPQAQPRVPSGLHPQPRVPTGQHPRLPTGAQQRVPTGQYRPPTGQYRPPTGQYRPTSGLHNTPYYPAKKKSDSALYVILGLVLVAVGVIYFVVRDPWEANNRALILQLKSEGDALRTTQKQVAAYKYEKLIKLVGTRTLSDPQLVDAYKEARQLHEQLQSEITDARYAETRQTETKANNDYAKYTAKAQPLLDAMMRVKVDADAKTDMARYEDDFKEVAVQYERWERALDGDEARYHSARLFAVLRDSYKTGLSWWAIKTAKKMPDALYADYMRDQEWSRAEYALKKIKVCMDAKEAVERKTCGPCEGTGRIKCPVCLGTGTCPYCKGKGNPDLNCCTNGVCDACKGRKDSQCAICNGQGMFPPK